MFLPPAHLALVRMPGIATSAMPGSGICAEGLNARHVSSPYSVTLTGTCAAGMLSNDSPSTAPAVSAKGKIHSSKSMTGARPASPPGSSGATSGAVVPSTYFGLHVLGFQQHFAPLAYATARSWDAFDFHGNGLAWADTNPSPGVYNWTVLDEYLTQMQGKDIMYVFGRTPAWASMQPKAVCTYGPGQCAPPNLSAWKNFVMAVVQHAGTKVKYWELWNEPNFGGTWIGDVPSMVTMAKAAYAIIKSINPSAVVLSPSAAGTDGVKWMTKFVADGGGSAFDVLAFHGYTSPAGIAEGELPIVTDYQALAHGKPMWDTEAGWNSISLTTAQQQAFMARAYLLQWPAVSRFIWYAYDSSPQWGQMWSPGGQNTVATAFDQVQKWMVGANMRPCIKSGNIYTCQLSRPGYIGEVTWIPGSTATIPAPAGMKQYRDLSGFVHAAGSTVTIGDSPILLETATPPTN